MNWSMDMEYYGSLTIDHTKAGTEPEKTRNGQRVPRN